LIKAAGTSISHWFKDSGREIKTFIDPVRNIQMPYTPYGRFIHVPPSDPLDCVESVPLPWWKNPRYIIGKVVLNTLFFSLQINVDVSSVDKENYDDKNNKYVDSFRRCH
jgi:hypothetical protein